MTDGPRHTDAPTWALFLARFFRATAYFLWALAIGLFVLAVVEGAWWVALLALLVIAGRVGMWRLRERNRIEVDRWQHRGDRGPAG